MERNNSLKSGCSVRLSIEELASQLLNCGERLERAQNGIVLSSDEIVVVGRTQ